MKKKIILFSVLLSFAFGSMVYASGKRISLLFDSKPLEIDFLMKDNKIYVPIRDWAAVTGMKVNWDNKGKTAHVESPDHILNLDNYITLLDAVGKYTDVEIAQQDGYLPVFNYIEHHGYHYFNPTVTTFDLTKPNLLIYSKGNNGEMKLVATEYVALEIPDMKPLGSGEWEFKPAAAHYTDGSHLPIETPDKIPAVHPETGAKLDPILPWTPPSYTYHVWLVPNPNGVVSDINPLISH
jgi:hypothetical protein